MWLFYQVALSVLLVASAPFLLLVRGRHYLPTLPGRLGLGAAATGRERPLWIHAVSVGEVLVAATLVEALPRSLPLLVTTITPTGQERARELLGGRAVVTYLPFDLAFALGPFFRRHRPRALVLVEGELWPLLLRRARREGLRVVVINGRVSDRSFPRLLRARRFLPAVLGNVDRFGVQSPQDRERLLALGVDAARVEVTGNLKYESPPPPRHPELERRLLALAGGRPLILAGSTMRGEEEKVLEAFERLGPERALLLLAPRHPERFDSVAGLIERRGLRLLRRSRLDRQHTEQAPQVVLLDTLGELAALYALGRGAFIGGTLVPTGGHNPLEPARLGVAIAAGPSMENFHEIAAHFDAARAWERVADAAELADCLGRWIADAGTAAALGRRARLLAEQHRGARRRTLALLAGLVPISEQLSRADDSERTAAW